MVDQVVIQRERMCDFCRNKADYDGRTTLGTWAYMCPIHFEMYGVGLGLGRGQKLVVIDDQVPNLEEIEEE